MNRVRQLCATILLTVILAASPVLAGDMPCGVTSSPPPPTETSATGEMPMGVTSSSTASDASVTGNMPMGVTSETDPVTELMLSLLQSMLALF
jgi:hypothetical protein